MISSPHRARPGRADRRRRHAAEEAERRYRQAERILLEEARLALEERPLPPSDPTRDR